MTVDSLHIEAQLIHIHDTQRTSVSVGVMRSIQDSASSRVLHHPSAASNRDLHHPFAVSNHALRRPSAVSNRARYCSFARRSDVNMKRKQGHKLNGDLPEEPRVPGDAASPVRSRQIAIIAGPVSAARDKNAVQMWTHGVGNATERRVINDLRRERCNTIRVSDVVGLRA